MATLLLIQSAHNFKKFLLTNKRVKTLPPPNSGGYNNTVVKWKQLRNAYRVWKLTHPQKLER